MVRIYGINTTGRPQTTHKDGFDKGGAAGDLQKMAEKLGFLDVTTGYL